MYKQEVLSGRKLTLIVKLANILRATKCGLEVILTDFSHVAKSNIITNNKQPGFLWDLSCANSNLGFSHRKRHIDFQCYGEQAQSVGLS